MKKLLMVLLTGGFHYLFCMEQESKIEFVELIEPEKHVKGIAAPEPSHSYLFPFHETEPTSKRPFSNILAERKAEQLFFIIAQVTASVNQFMKLQYFDAYNLCEKIQNDETVNPVTGSQLYYMDGDLKCPIYDIKLFQYSPQQQSTIYIGSNNDFFSPNEEVKKFVNSVIEANRPAQFMKDIRQITHRSNSQYEAGHEFFKKKMYDIAKLYFEQTAATTNVHMKAAAEFMLGQIHLVRNSEFTDFQKAFTYFQNSSRQTINTTAQSFASLYLGVCHLKGYGVPENPQIAYQHFTRVANQYSNIEARMDSLLYLGDMHYKGTGMTEDKDQAIANFQIVAEQNEYKKGQILAQLRLGQAKYKKKEYGEALDNMNRVAEQNDRPYEKALALHYLAKMYYYGRGIKKDERKAQNYFETVSQQSINDEAKLAADKMLYKIRENKNTNDFIANLLTAMKHTTNLRDEE